MSTARVTSLVLEVLTPDDFTGATTTVGAGGGGGAVSATTERSTRIAGGGSGGGTTVHLLERSTSIVGAGEGGGSLRGGSAPAGVPTVTYAEIIDGVVVGVHTGPLPESTSVVLFIDLTDYGTPPAVGWYWTEVCQQFSETPPVVPPGDIVPPWTRPRDGTDGQDGTDGLPGGPGPIPLAFTMPVLVPFHAHGVTGLTVTNAPVALTEVDPKMRTAYDLTDVCAIRLQCDVRTALAGAELVLCYSLNSGSTWALVADPLDYDLGGPFVSIGATGDRRGEYRNPVVAAQTEVLLSVFVRGGDGSSDPVVGNLGALMYTKTSVGACSIIPPTVTCPVFPAFTLGPAGFLWQDDFTAYADEAALLAVYNNSTSSTGVQLYRCSDDNGSHVGGGIINTKIGDSIRKNLDLSAAPVSKIWTRKVERVRADYDDVANALPANYDPLGQYSNAAGALVAVGGNGYAAVGRVFTPTYPVSTFFGNGSGTITEILATPIDIVAYKAGTDHELIACYEVTPGAPGTVTVRLWLDGVLVAHATIAQTLATAFTQVQVNPYFSLHPENFGRLITRLVEVYDDATVSDPYGIGP